MAVSAIQKFVNQLSRNPNVLKVVSEFNRLGGELVKRGQELNDRFYAGSERTLEQAHARVQQVVKAVSEAQEQLDSEVNAAVLRIKKSASSVEKGLESYRKKALQQKTKIEKMLKAQSKKNAAAKKTSKKTAKRATTKKKTTRKA